MAMQESLQICTGTHEVLNFNGVNMTILSNGLVEVPKYFWKVVRDAESGREIALVAVNNVLEMVFERICGEDLCLRSKWYTDGCGDFTKGSIY